MKICSPSLLLINILFSTFLLIPSPLISKEMSDLFPVGSGEFLGKGGDGALELQDTCVSLGQRIPQALELLRKTSEFTLCLFQLGLKDRNK